MTPHESSLMEAIADVIHERRRMALLHAASVAVLCPAIAINAWFHSVVSLAIAGVAAASLLWTLVSEAIVLGRIDSDV
jgi:hypothetical protein